MNIRKKCVQFRKRMPFVLLAITAAIVWPTNAYAASPGSVMAGKQLFERDWPSDQSGLGSDGLGPLFNGTSCVACHHQGGVGGGGDAPFNAKTIGIAELEITGGRVTGDVVVRMVRSFHPGFIGPGGKPTNTFPLAHHGGSPAFDQARSNFLKKLPVRFSEDGGPADAAEVRAANATPIIYSGQVGKYTMTLRGRLFQRNTTALFGVGLIDQVTDRDLDALMQSQKRHPEVSGRPATLNDGRYGKFGWRGNVASLVEFCDQACANELGLETKRKPQSLDPTRPLYRNASIGVSDQQVQAMADFIAALPVPTRELPSDSFARAQVGLGERLFDSVGCSVCHIRDVGPAKGIYSDLLLHDMGYELMDLNHAEPYIKGATPVTRVSRSAVVTTRSITNSVGYYGGTSEMLSVDSFGANDSGDRGSQSRPSAPLRFRFVAPTGPSRLLDLITLNTEQSTESSTSRKRAEFSNRMRRGVTDTTRTTNVTTTREDYLRVHYEPTSFNQEWRTPPLWGARDSAPYMHDGRAETLLEAIAMHDGEAAGIRDRFLQLPATDRQAVLAFLNSMVVSPQSPQQAF